MYFVFLSSTLIGTLLILSSCSIAKPISVRETLFGKRWREDYNIELGATALDVTFDDNTYTSYTISVNGNKWLESGMTGFRNNGDWATLKLNKTETVQGKDSFGSYSDMSILWDDTKNNGYQFVTVVRQYPSDPDLVLFIQGYPNGAMKASTGSADKVVDYVTNNELQWQLLGNISTINAAMRTWGDKQLSYYGKRRGSAHDRDFTLNYLGNSTQMSSGEIWSSTSRIGENELFRYIYVFVVLLDANLKIYPSDISYHFEDDTNSRWLAYETNTTDTFIKFDYDTPLEVLGGGQYGGKYAFQLYTLIPVGNPTGSD